MTEENQEKFEYLQIYCEVYKTTVEYVDNVLFEIRDLLALQKNCLNIDSEIFTIIEALVDSTYPYLAQTHTLEHKKNIDD